jgi:hypothetical protein
MDDVRPLLNYTGDYSLLYSIKFNYELYSVHYNIEFLPGLNLVLLLLIGDLPAKVTVGGLIS